MRDLARRLEALERLAASRSRAYRAPTRADWIRYAKMKAVIVTHWLGDPQLALWQRLYSGIAKGNEGADAASSLRYPLRHRFDWAASRCGPVATGAMHLKEIEAFHLVPESDQRVLWAGLEQLPERHPELIDPDGVKTHGPWLFVSECGRVAGRPPTEAEIKGPELAAFGVAAGIAAIRRQEFEIAAWDARRA